MKKLTFGSIKFDDEKGELGDDDDSFSECSSLIGFFKYLFKAMNK